MSGTFSIGGLASGLDTKSLIDQLMSLESQPIAQLQTKQQALSQANSVFQSLNTRVSALSSAASDLTLDLNITAKSAATTDSTILTATAGASSATGTYQVRVAQLASASTVKSTAGVGNPITDANMLLGNMPLSATPSSGNFTLHWVKNGVASMTTVAVDGTADTLQDVMNRVGAQSGGMITAALGTGSQANKLVFTSATDVSSVVFGSSSDTSNFLNVVNARTLSITKTSASSTSAVSGLAAGATLASLGVTGTQFTVNYTNGGSAFKTAIAIDPAVDTVQNLMDRIGTATGSSVSASLGTGTAVGKLIIGPANGTTAVSFGATTDDSNLFATMKLTGQTIDTTATSSGNIGVSQLNAPLNGTGALGNPLGTAITFPGSGTGTFTINGTSINYTATDTLNDVLSRINSSSAGVTAAYNSIEDRVTLTARTTGSGGITLADGTESNLLGSLGLLSADSITNGQNAKIGVVGINGFTGTTDPTLSPETLIESSTNSFSNVAPGLSLTAAKTDSALQTVNVTNDTATPIAKLKAFVDQYNQLTDAVTSATATGQPNAYNSDLRGMLSRVRSYLYSQVSGLDVGNKSLVDLGLATSTADKVHLALDETKFKDALTGNPDRVADIFRKTTTVGTTTTPQGIFAQLKTYLTSVTDTQGVFQQHDKSTQAQTRSLADQILSGNSRLADRRASLVKQFAAMEAAVSTLHSQQSALTSQLSSLG